MSDTPDKTVCRGGWAMPPSSLMIQAGNDYYTCSICGERCDDSVHDSVRKGGESATVKAAFKTGYPPRVLGHLRIFQSVVNDLGLDHDISDKSYLYEGVDPYQFEDSAFPMTTAAIQAYAHNLARERLERVQAMAEDLLRDTSLYIDSNTAPAEIVRQQKRKREARLFNDALLEVNEIIKQELESL